MNSPGQTVLGHVEFQTLTEANWRQFEMLMGEKGGCGGCWCMSFRLPSKEFAQNKYNGNKQHMHALVKAEKPTGLLATVDKQTVGWIAFAPREDYCRIEKSRAFPRVDEQPVWSITCFFIGREWRNKGLSVKLIEGVIHYAKTHGIRTLEAYPAIPYSPRTPAPFLWVGTLSAFLKNGFYVVRRNGKSRAMVRFDIE